jgi:hypothetical protein
VVDVGLKRTVTEHEALTASEVPQSVDANEKSVPATDAAAGVVTESGPTPVFVSVAVPVFEAPTAVAAKLGVDSEPACETPVPVTAREAAPDGAEAETVKLPLYACAAVGAMRKVMLQLAPAAKFAAHVLVATVTPVGSPYARVFAATLPELVSVIAAESAL